MCSNLQVETIFNCLDVAYRLNASELKQKCLQYLADNNERIQDQPEWISMTDKEPQIVRDLCKQHQETLRQKEQKITELEARLERRDPLSARRHMREQLEHMNRRLRNIQEARNAIHNPPPPIVFQQPQAPRIEPIRVFINNDERRRRERLRELANEAVPLLQEVPQDAIPAPNAEDPMEDVNVQLQQENDRIAQEMGNNRNEVERDRRRHRRLVMELEQRQQRLDAQQAHREDLVRQLGEVRQGLGELLQNNVIRRHRVQMEEEEQQRFQALEENVGHNNEPGPCSDQPNNVAVEQPNVNPRRRRGEHAIEGPAPQRRRIVHGIRINVDNDIAEQARRNRPDRQIEVVDLAADDPPAGNDQPARERRRGRPRQNRQD
ncbi:hypothetical protein M3Y97_01000200 [Aphelenchoides bicaudatus]|nr:hypothetical protein M3Y97_01000200 [Aphelenchoides bicaudatus]